MNEQHCESGRRASLKTDFTYALFMVLGITCIIVTVTDSYMVYVRNTRMLATRAENTMDKAVETLVQPLWHYDEAFVRTFADILSNDKSLLHLSVFDEQGRGMVRFDRRGHASVREKFRWELERPVLYNGRTIGRIAMAFTNGDVWMMTKQMILSDLAIMFTALFVVVGTSWVLINRQILNPLAVMGTAFRRISAGDYSRRVRLKNKNELSEIADEFNIMVEQVASRDSRVRESETKYRNLVEGTTDIIFRTDPDGCLIYMNRNFEKWTGFQAADFLGKPFHRLLALGDTRDAFEKLKKGVLAGSDNLHEIQVTRRDGSLVHMELNITIQTDLDGSPVGAMGIARDITRRKRSEEELRKYEQMVAAFSDGMWLTDGNLVIQAVNAAYIASWGRDRASLVNRSVSGVMGEALFREHVKHPLEACLKGESANHCSWVNTPVRGRRFIDFTFSPIFNENNAVVGVVVNERDLTEQKTLEAQLQQSQKMEAIGTLAGGIAHDFNNILGSIIGYGELIEMFDVEKNDRVAERIGYMLEGAYRARELVDQILTFSRRGDQDRSLLGLIPIVKESLKFLRASIPSTIAIEEVIECTSDVVLANATQVHQVLLNLCSNASYAMQETGGTLRVGLTDAALHGEEAKLTGPHLRLSVSDTGPGIEPRVMARIFEPFFTTKKTGDGTGMGLAVVHGIVESLNGTVTVESSPEIGTAFHLLLPVGIGRCPEKKGEDLKKVSRGNGKILFVDDEAGLVKLSSEILGHLGYDVVKETSSIRARDLFMENPDGFDLVITDQTMPEMTGFDLAVEILAVRPDIPVVLCTGFSSPDLEAEARRAGICKFMKKPIGARQLGDLVSRIVHRDKCAMA